MKELVIGTGINDILSRLSNIDELTSGYIITDSFSNETVTVKGLFPVTNPEASKKVRNLTYLTLLEYRMFNEGTDFMQFSAGTIIPESLEEQIQESLSKDSDYSHLISSNGKIQIRSNNEVGLSVVEIPNEAEYQETLVRSLLKQEVKMKEFFGYLF